MFEIGYGLLAGIVLNAVIVRVDYNTSTSHTRGALLTKHNEKGRRNLGFLVPLARATENRILCYSFCRTRT